MAIKIPAAVHDAITAQSVLEQLPPPATREEKDEFLASVHPEFSNEAETHFDRLVDRAEGQRILSMEEAVKSLAKWLNEVDFGRFQKPLLTLEEAANLLSISPKRLENIIGEERKRLGRSPDFVVDADGRIQRRVLRDALLDWVKGRPRVGRHRKVARAA